MALDELSGTDIGRQHRLLDQAVRLGTGAWHDFFNPAVVVADDLGLGGLEVDRASQRAILQQDPVDLVQVDQMRHQIGAALSLDTSGVAQDRRHLVVCQPSMRTNHRRVELVGRDLTGCGHQHVADHGQPLLVRVERTQTVADALGQHRDHPAREVHRGRALVSVVVKRLAGFDIVADIGDRDNQAPALECCLAAPSLERLAIHRVVKVTRILAIDGHQRHIGQVNAMSLVDRANTVRQGRSLRQSLGRESMWHLVLAHCNLDFHARIVDLAQHLGDPPHRL